MIDTQTDRQTARETDRETERQTQILMQARAIPEGQNWSQVKVYYQAVVNKTNSPLKACASHPLTPFQRSVFGNSCIIMVMSSLSINNGNQLNLNKHRRHRRSSRNTVTVKITGMRTAAGKTHVGPVNLLHIIMFKIRKLKTNSGAVWQKP